MQQTSALKLEFHNGNATAAVSAHTIDCGLIICIVAVACHHRGQAATVDDGREPNWQLHTVIITHRVQATTRVKGLQKAKA
jgi:hypothetical protein